MTIALLLSPSYFCFGYNEPKKVLSSPFFLFLLFGCNTPKKATTTLLPSLSCFIFIVVERRGDGNNVVTFFYGGGVMEKAMAEGNFFSFIFFKKQFVVFLV